MYYADRHHTTRLTERLGDGCYWLLERAHAFAGRSLSLAGGALGCVLSRIPWSCRFGIMSAAMCLVAVYLGVLGEEWLIGAAELEAEHVAILRKAGILASFRAFSFAAAVVGLAQIPASLVSFARRRLALRLLKFSGAAFAAVWLFLLVFLVRAPSVLHTTDSKIFDELDRNHLWITGVWLWIPVALLAAAFLLCLALRSVGDFYSAPAGEDEPEPLGERIVRKLKAQGDDPRFTTSSYWSMFAHVFVLFLLPGILRGCGMEKAYAIPKGSGNPVVQFVKVKKIKRKKKKRLVLNMNSPIIFYRPDLDDTDVLKEVEQETLDTYVATSLKAGKLGKGGGTKGGWPSGMENAKIRFIRLEYRGGDWDQDMGVGADHNLLVQLHKITGFMIAPNTEHIPINRLRRFPKHRAPPFVFITGMGGISVSRKDVKALRWYCLEEGGMLFADNGGGSFNSSFRALMRRVFPDLRWVDIASDDVIYRMPFVFPNGAPPLWHHSGYRALGLKHDGRWVVFYHQGDLNDGWKTGHSGLTEGQAMQAYKLGINVVNYAFNQYVAIHFGE